MNQPRPACPALAGFLIAATLIAGCGATPAPTTGSAANDGPAISAPVIGTPPNPVTTPGPATAPAMQARQSAVAFYLAAGFTAVTDSVLNRGNRQITLVAENRDHSATETTLVIQLGTT